MNTHAHAIISTRWAEPARNMAVDTIATLPKRDARAPESMLAANENERFPLRPKRESRSYSAWSIERSSAVGRSLCPMLKKQPLTVHVCIRATKRRKRTRVSRKRGIREPRSHCSPPNHVGPSSTIKHGFGRSRQNEIDGENYIIRCNVCGILSAALYRPTGGLRMMNAGSTRNPNCGIELRLDRQRAHP